ncbi:Ribosomal protein L11 methyltransferase [compost metagenome]
MNYLELAITVPAEAAEAVAWSLTERGVPGVVVSERSPEDPLSETSTLKAYFPEVAPPDMELLEAGIREGLSPFPGAEYQVETRTLPEENWATSWQKYWHVQRIGEHVIVRPSWEEYEAQPGDLVITLDPKQAFGTGTHATTRLCMRAIERKMSVTPAETVYDVGAGTGILAILAAMMGAKHVTAVDNDPVAVAAAEENATINEVAVTNRVGSADDLKGQADLVVANILAEVIIELAPELWRITRPGGRLVTSGIISRKADDVAQALAAQGFNLLERESEGDWVLVEADRPL